MSKTFRPYAPRQAFLLLPSPLEWLPQDHLALFIMDIVQVALDGTKVKANTSKHKAMSYERMKKDDQRLREQVSELLAKAEQVDDEEDAVYGKGRSGDELPEDLRHAKDRRERIRQLMKELEEETKQQQEAEKAAKDKDEPPPPPTGDGLPSHKIPTTADGKPTP